MKKSLAWYFVPPIAGVIRKKVVDHRGADKLFDGDGALFKSLLLEANVYGEYGCGKSTTWVAKNSGAQIYSVESSKEWAARVAQNVSSSRMEMEWVDLGEIGDWGRPVDYRKRDNFETYIYSIWRRPKSPDVVLIDGRFRVACFLASLLNGKPGTKIIFDDYRDRRHYHIVEEFLQPMRWCGRQALFEINDGGDRNMIIDIINKFEYVMD